jgi:hypothetical protein
MGVRRKDLDIRWFSSLVLIVLGGLIYRAKRRKDKHLTMSLDILAQKYFYVPAWMQTIIKARAKCEPKMYSLSPPSETDSKKIAINYIGVRGYKRTKWLADKILFR